MMFKRNDGYALSYVLVVLMVLCIIATAVMAPPLRNLQMQQASIERMQEKYVAQGMVEQVVAQLEDVSTLPLDLTSITIQKPAGCNCSVTLKDGYTDVYTIQAETEKTTIAADIKLSENTTEDAEGNQQFESYTVTYDSYDISYNTGGGE